jgi:hypothetical protein
MTRQDRSGQDDMSRGDGGPPRVRYPVGGPATAKPLFVDCSVEYELPKMAKIPADSLPLLMLHPKWQQKKPTTRSTSQQRQQLLPPSVQPQFRSVQQHPLQQTLFCSQCPLPASAASGRGRKRAFNELHGHEDARLAGSSSGSGSGEKIPLSMVHIYV